MSRHKASGQAVVRLDGRWRYLGKYGLPETEEKYRRVVAEWLACQQPAAGECDHTISDISVAELTPSQRIRRPKRTPRRTPRNRYTPDSYRRCIARACNKADVPKWHPHQLRHNAATRLRKQFGIEAARVVLGHRSAAVTEIYAEVDRAKAAEIMARIG